MLAIDLVAVCCFGLWFAMFGLIWQLLFCFVYCVSLFGFGYITLWCFVDLRLLIGLGYMDCGIVLLIFEFVWLIVAV